VAKSVLITEVEEILLIEKRKAEMRSGKVKGIPHEKVMADLRKHLKKFSK